MWKSSPIESLSFNPKEMASRPFQIMSTLYYLHIYFKQNSNYDKFDLERHNLKWVFENSLHGLADLWLLSKLQKLILSVTSSFESCRFHEGAKALEEFIINFISQTYVPITRNEIWDDSIDHLDRRLAKYSVLSHTLHQVDILMHPLAPFITEYLYQTCFKREESITLKQWPKYCESLVRDNIENSFDTVKEISSLANAARVKAQLKRRWPVKHILICCSDTSFLEVSGIGEILKNQLNTESYEIIKTKENADSKVQLLNLLENKLPIRVNGSLVIRNIASRERNRINLVKEVFEKTNKCDILKLLHTTGSYPLKYEGGETYLYAADVNFSYDAAEGYTMAKRDDLIVFLSKHRNERLSAKGLLRDIARNLQQLRKERGYNPTDILSEAYVALLEREEISVLGEMKAELIYLVRVKSIFLTKDAIDKVNYKSIEFDGRELLISVE
jgi:isoleucyl-tRNA synthetase